ncbi:hypothetical protein JCM10908_004071 [Rhodotorula pacifica]|uniref:uncharacterized protein n=1 Tax=Rhodotorula pacifica TaxID=1495444 RepID=UPI00317D5AEE
MPAGSARPDESMADSDDEERPARRVQEPLGRLDDQRAGFTSSTGTVTSTSSLLYGQAIYPAARPLRPAPKSAGSASLPLKPVPSRHTSAWDYDGAALRAQQASPYHDISPPLPRGRRRSRPAVLAMSPTPFADPAVVDQLTPPPTPETSDFRRRGSAVSTSSGQSLPHAYPRAPSSASASLKRHSVSSFGAYTINTVGDMSMSSSVPLLDRNRRGSVESFYDNTSTFGWSPSGRIRASSLATPAPVYLADYSMAKRAPSPAHRLPRLQSNPLAPLRKRLARSLAATGRGRRLHTEVQLLLELVEALDACVASLAHTLVSDTVPPDRPRASTSTLPVSPSHTSPSKRSETAGHAGTSRLVAVDEVRLLVQELVELIPDAQRCLRDGAYGPLVQSGVSTDALLQSLEALESNSSANSANSPHPSSPVSPTAPAPINCWPARLARDCRALLEEAGLPSTASGANAAAWLQLAADSPSAQHEALADQAS